MVHGRHGHRQPSGFDPFFVFECAYIAEALWAYIAAAVAFDAVEKLFLPESQLFGLAFSGESFGYGIGHTCHGLAHGYFRMSGVRLGAATEERFLMRAWQVDRWMVPVDSACFTISTCPFFAAPASQQAWPGMGF
jgi:hypothetical protein